MTIKTVSISTIFVLACSATAMAQNSPSAKNTLSENLGDWTVRCFSVQSASPCDVYQEQQDKNSHLRDLSTSIAYVPSSSTYVIQIMVPLSVKIPAGLIIKSGGYTSAILPYRRCDQNGCYVEMAAPQDSINELSRSNGAATVNVQYYAGLHVEGKNFALPLSLKGFSAALSRMVQLAKQKATPAK